MANGANDHQGQGEFHVIENAKLSNAKFPDRRLMVPGRNQTRQGFLVAGKLNGFMSQLLLDAIQNRFAIGGS